MNAQWLKTDGTVLTVEPRDRKKFSLQELQSFVGGLIELVIVGDYTLVINEEGKLNELPFNELATQEYVLWHGNTDVLVGDVLLCPTRMLN